jgi:beta-glucanase (GH16 family)
LNESRWEILYTGSGNGNKELQFYTKRLDNLRIEDGVLKITGKREGFEGKGYTSGKIQSRSMGDWGPGVRVEVRAKLPLGRGTWPAIWMMPTEYNYGEWPRSGEIDIMEAVGKAPGKVFGTIHTGAYNHMIGTQKGKSFYTDFSEWHTYALNWYEDRLEWFADGNLYNTFHPGNLNDYAKWPFNRRFYLILNLALGGNLGGPIGFGGEHQIMEVDYARVYCLDGSTTCKTEQITCCGNCAGTGKAFCSQRSGNCYDTKRQDYYNECPVERAPAVEPVAPETPSSPESPSPACCGGCGDKGYCSPKSSTCYDFKKKTYYDRCFTGVAPCCGKCGSTGYCSPMSSNCYSSKNKDYYESCSA